MKYRFLILCFFTLVILQLSVKVYALIPLSQGSFQLVLTQNGSIGVQEENLFWTMELTSANTLNGSGHILQYSGTGEFEFESNTTGTMEVNTNIASLRVRINEDNVVPLGDGGTFNFLNGDNVVIFWNIPLTPLFPILFALGMFGLASMFGGSIYGAYLIKKREFNEDPLIMTLVMITVGIALFIAWVTA